MSNSQGHQTGETLLWIIRKVYEMELSGPVATKFQLETL